MSTDPIRQALNGPTRGTRGGAPFHAAPVVDPAHHSSARRAAVEPADALMVTGGDARMILAGQSGLDALFLSRDASGGVQSMAIGRPFSGKPAASAADVGD